MSRTTPSAVRTVLGETELTDSEIQSFIDDASLIVDEFASDLDSDAKRSKAVEKYFTVELIAVREPRAMDQEAVGTSETYQRGDADENFQTDEGRKANMLSGGMLLSALQEEGDALDWQIGTYA